MFARKSLKVLHTLSSLALTGGVLGYMALVSYGPAPALSDDYLTLRDGIYALSRYVIMPAMLLVLVSGLLAMAVHYPFQSELWVWAKALSGILVFEAVLASVDSPARRAASAIREAMAEPEAVSATAEALVRDHWGALWILLGLSAANVILGIWRPRWRPRKLS